MTDQADKDAEELLPNAWWARPAVAAKLRERDSLIATAEALNKSLIKSIDRRVTEIELLETEWVRIKRDMEQEIERVKAANASLAAGQRKGGQTPGQRHSCCGCSCYVCEDGHRADGYHTVTCWDRILKGKEGKE